MKQIFLIVSGLLSALLVQSPPYTFQYLAQTSSYLSEKSLNQVGEEIFCQCGCGGSSENSDEIPPDEQG